MDIQGARVSDPLITPHLVKQIAPLVGGRGGGKPDLAQGSGTDVGGADAAMARIRELVLR